MKARNVKENWSKRALRARDQQPPQQIGHRGLYLYVGSIRISVRGLFYCWVSISVLFSRWVHDGILVQCWVRDGVLDHRWVTVGV